MEISAYLKQKDFNNSFENNYKSLNGILFLFSFLGNLASIVFAYFFLNTILTNVTDNFWGKALFTGLISVLALTAFEFLKRFLFKQAALTYLTGRSKTEKYIISGLSLLIISTSFYLSISGANTLSDKSQKIEGKTTEQINKTIDNINRDYNIKTDKINKQIDAYTQLITIGTKSRSLRTQYNTMILAANQQLDKLNLQKGIEITTAKNDLNNQKNILTVYSNNNVKAFLILSTFIELIILIGVAFDTYYNHRVFKDYDLLAQTNRKYKYYVLYNRLLDAVYSNGKIGKNNPILSACILAKIAKSIDLNVTTPQVNTFYSLLGQLNVTKIETRSKRIALVDLATAKAALKQHYQL